MEWRRQFGFYEKVYTAIDLAAALLFILGSILFFFEAWETTGTWAFLFGSILFAARPVAQFLREYHLARIPLPDDRDD